MPTLTEGMHAGEALGEFALGPAYHNDKVTVLSGQNLSANAVVGSVPSATVASAAKAGGNTGNGTFVVDATAPAQPRVIEGVYTLRCVTAVTNGGVFRLERPDGVVIGDVPSWRVDNMPYGGVKDSGLGREGVKFAIEDMTEIRLLVIRDR